jgi:hypothetical protein
MAAPGTEIVDNGEVGGVALETTQLDGAVDSNYIGRRPSSSGRDTKRIRKLLQKAFTS